MMHVDEFSLLPGNIGDSIVIGNIGSPMTLTENTFKNEYTFYSNGNDYFTG